MEEVGSAELNSFAVIAFVLVVPLVFAEGIQGRHSKKDWIVHEWFLAELPFRWLVLLVFGLLVPHTIDLLVLCCGIGIRTMM